MKREEVQPMAEKVIEVTMEGAKALPNMLGRICPSHLKQFGFYGAMVDGVKTLYVLKEDPLWHAIVEQ